ncbi:hypothetical protein C8J57DRAFT_1672672 [Mycena rebaudengoi]|nr:hypothetical protein C8J57DRAFT_1672672 [Mycena rebaudengoi]
MRVGGGGEDEHPSTQVCDSLLGQVRHDVTSRSLSRLGVAVRPASRFARLAPRLPLTRCVSASRVTSTATTTTNAGASTSKSNTIQRGPTLSAARILVRVHHAPALHARLPKPTHRLRRLPVSITRDIRLFEAPHAPEDARAVKLPPDARMTDEYVDRETAQRAATVGQKDGRSVSSCSIFLSTIHLSTVLHRLSSILCPSARLVLPLPPTPTPRISSVNPLLATKPPPPQDAEGKYRKTKSELVARMESL